MGNRGIECNMKKHIIKIIKERTPQAIEFYNDNYNLFKFLLTGFMYIACILLILNIAKKIIEYPVLIAYKYNIQLSGAEYSNIFKEYKFIVLGTLIISICAIPIVRLVNRLKSATKNGIEFYTGDQQQNIINVSSIMKNSVPHRAVEDLISSDDTSCFDEKSEEDLNDVLMRNQDEQLELLKCQNIKNNMKPLTASVTRELYYNYKSNITYEITIEYVKNIRKHKRKKDEEKNKEITKNIIYFLKNNDIIESDDIEDEKYYFTSFGNKYMNYFLSGII